MQLSMLKERLNKELYELKEENNNIEVMNGLYMPNYIKLEKFAEEFPIINEIEPEPVTNEEYNKIDVRILKNIDRLNQYFSTKYSCGGHIYYVTDIPDFQFLKKPEFYTENDTYEKQTLCLFLSTDVYVSYSIPELINIGLPLSQMKNYILSPTYKLYENDIILDRDTSSIFVDDEEYASFVMLNDKSVDIFSKSIGFELEGDRMTLRLFLPFTVTVPFTEQGIKLAHSLFDKTIENMIGITNIMKNGKVYKPCM